MKETDELHEIVKNLRMLDTKNLLLIKSGIELLLARQNIEEVEQMKTDSETKTEQAVV